MKVVITDHGFPGIVQEQEIMAQAGASLLVAQARTPEALIVVCHDADALLVQWSPITKEVIDALEHCRVIVRYGIGTDNIDLQAATEKGIPVCNVPDYCIPEVADHSLALALALARQLPQTDAVFRGGEWKIIPPTPFPAFRDVTFATAGFGRIARAVLDRARVFGFQTAAYDPFVSSEDFKKAGVRQLDRGELYQEAGILSLHLPLLPETRHFVNRDTLARMRKDAIIVNTARGALIDTVALAEALHSGTIQAAGIDVFEAEPPALDHPLRTAPRTILTSHTAWYSSGSIPILQSLAAKEVVRALEGKPLQNVVNAARPKN